ncbi:MAG: hypothetical protein ABSG92_11135 [Conexivisphaerales archaeon]
MAAFALALFASAAVSGPPPPGPARAATTWSVTMDTDTMAGFIFNPQAIVINVGDTVNWTDVVGTHTTTSDPGQNESWDSGQLYLGQSFAFTFTIPGTYRYSSTLDDNMIGEVVVQAPVPEFPGPFAFVAVGLATCVGLALERALRRSP